MENKPKKRSVFNIFDITLIVIAIILAVCIFALRKPSKNAPVPETDEPVPGMVSYTVEITGMQNGSAHMVAVGDKLVERSHKWDMGTVTAVEVTPTTRRTFNENTMEYSDVDTELTETAIITILASCTEDAGNINVAGNQPIKVGASIRLNGPGYYGAATVIGIERGSLK